MNYKRIAELLSELSAEFSKLAESTEVKTEERVEKTSKKSSKKSEERTETDAAEKSSVSVDELNEMKFNELKKYAATVGVSATGKRDEIIKRILEVENGDEEAVAEEPKKFDKKSGKKSKKKEEKVVDFEDKKAENDEYVEQADAMLDEYEEDSIIDELKDVGMKGVTKKTLRKKLIEALKKGLIDFDDDDDEDDADGDVVEGNEEDIESSDDDGEEIDENTYFEDFDDDIGSNNPDNVSSSDRLKAMVEVQSQILEDLENDDLDIDNMREFLNDNSTEDEQEEIKDFDDDEVIAAFIELRKRMIDDDGDDMSDEDDPYMVNDEVFARGHKCPEVDGEYVDEVSGETFTLDD